MNWLTTSAAPPVSSSERSKRPASSSKTRSRATLPASRTASSSPSPSRDPEQHEQAGADLAAQRALNRHRGTRNPLQDGLHLLCDSTSCTAHSRPITGARMEAAAHPWPALGALLMRDGSLTVEQLEQALRDKETSGKRLGEILVDRGLRHPDAGFPRPRRAARAPLRRSRARDHRHRGSRAPLRDPRPPLQRDPGAFPRRRRCARRRQRPDQRHGLGRPSHRARRNGPGGRRLRRGDRERDHAASIPTSSTSTTRPRRPRRAAPPSSISARRPRARPRPSR